MRLACTEPCSETLMPRGRSLSRLVDVADQNILHAGVLTLFPSIHFCSCFVIYCVLSYIFMKFVVPT